MVGKAGLSAIYDISYRGCASRVLGEAKWLIWKNKKSGARHAALAVSVLG